LGVGLVIDILQPVSINRLNILFVPLLLLMALPIVWLAEWSRIALGAAVGALLVGFAAFTFVYHGPQFRRQLDAAFFTGLMPALEFAGRAAPDQSVPICVTSQPNMPYIFVLFVDPADPRAYLPTIVYSNPRAPIRTVEKLGRYSFGTQNCPEDARAVCVLHTGEAPLGGETYETTTFDSYTVYTPAAS
jgi:hypothetical protein